LIGSVDGREVGRGASQRTESVKARCGVIGLRGYGVLIGRVGGREISGGTDADDRAKGVKVGCGAVGP
jgi:hypothetical protein